MGRPKIVHRPGMCQTGRATSWAWPSRAGCVLIGAMKPTLAFVAASLLALVGPSLSGCKGEPASSGGPPHEAVDPDDPASCAPCHGAIVAEWSASMHAQAHEDPIFTAMRAMRAGREGEAVGKACEGCHSPRVAARGVTCAACHASAPVGERGGLIAGPSDLARGLTPAHGTGPAAPGIKDGSGACMRCHEKLANPTGVSICTTGIEWREHAEKAGGEAKPCASCHMPVTPGPGTVTGKRTEHKAHRFVGPHARWAEGEVALEPLALALRFEGAALVATLTNLTGHTFPTGFPARMAVLELVGRDRSGAEVWRNFAKNPMAEAPDAVLNKVFYDDKGEPTIAPWSVKLARDTTLKAGEAREVRVAVPEAVVRVEARALMRLVAPTLADKLGLAKDPLATPRPVAKASATRPAP